MPPVVVRPGLEIPEEELTITTARSGGPGGQHVNKTESKVVLRWALATSRALNDEQKARLRAKVPPRFLTDDGEILLSCTEHRSQHENREACLARLAAVVRDGLKREKRRIATKPGRGAKLRRREGKERQSKKKEGRGQSGED